MTTLKTTQVKQHHISKLFISVSMIPCTLPQWHKTPLGHTNTLFWHSWRALHLNRMDLPLTSPRRWSQDTRWRFQVQLSDWSSISLNLGFPPIHQVLLLVQVIYITIIQCDWPGTHELLYPTILCNLSFFYHTSYLMCFTLYLKFAFLHSDSFWGRSWEDRNVENKN